MYNLTNGVFSSDNGYGVVITGAPKGYATSSVYLGADTHSASGVRVMFNNTTQNTALDVRGNAMSFRYTTDGQTFSNMLQLSNDTSVSNTFSHGAQVGGRVNASQYVVGSVDTRAPTNSGLYLTQNGTGHFSINKGTGMGGFQFSTYNTDGSLSNNHLNLTSNGVIQTVSYNKTSSPQDIESIAIMGFDKDGNMVRNYAANQRFRLSEARLTAIENDLSINVPVALNKIVDVIDRLNFFSSNIPFLQPFVLAPSSDSQTSVQVTATIPVMNITLQMYTSLPVGPTTTGPGTPFQTALIASIAATLGIPSSNVTITSVTAIIGATIARGMFGTTSGTQLATEFALIAPINTSGATTDASGNTMDAASFLTAAASTIKAAAASPTSTMNQSIASNVASATGYPIEANTSFVPPVSTVTKTVTVSVPVAAYPPTAPTNVVATLGSKIGTAIISFSSDPSAYLFTVKSSPSTVLTSYSSSPIVVSGLTSGQYTFTVNCKNANGTSAYSSASNTLTIVLVTPTPTPIPVDTSLNPYIWITTNQTIVDRQGSITVFPCTGSWYFDNNTTTSATTVSYVTGVKTGTYAVNLTSAVLIGNISLPIFTCAFWVYSTINAYNAFILIGTNYNVYLQRQTNGSYNVFTQGVGGTEMLYNTTTYINQWTHVAYSSSGSAFSIYFNGVLAVTINGTFPTFTQFQVGQQYPEYVWTGYAQDIRFYNSVLTGTQINSIYQILNGGCYLFSPTTTYGDYFQVQYPQAFIATSFQMLCRNNLGFGSGIGQNRTASSITIAGSNDGSTWYVVSQQTDLVFYTNVFVTLPACSSTPFSYYRVIATKISQQPYLIWDTARFNAYNQNSIYPPVPLTSDTLSGQAYGNGTYLITTNCGWGAEITGSKLYGMLGNTSMDSDGNYPLMSLNPNATYNLSTGAYTGSFYTTINPNSATLP